MEKLFAGDGEVKVGSDVMDLETRLSVIRALIPLGLEAVADVLQQEVEQLAGVRYARKGSEQSHRRWGSQKGSVYLMDQKLPVAVPRVRDVESDTEVSLAAYRGMQRPRAMDEKLCCFVCSRESPVATTEPVQSRYPKRSEFRHPPSRDGSSKPPQRS